MRIADVLPLTPLQQGLLFHAEAGRGHDDLYAVQVVIGLSGRLDVARLAAAVQTVVARHPHVAARFSAEFGEPVAVVPADPVVPWRVVEVDAAADVESSVEQVCAGERAAVFDLAGSPAVRAALVDTGAGGFRLVLTNHHIVLDGWSLPILLGEIFAAYEGRRLPAAVPYRRFVGWLTGRDVAAARSAWAEVLAGLEGPTLVGSGQSGQPGPRSVMTVAVPQGVSAAVGELARTARSTVSTVLQAGWAQVLMSLTGRRDVVFGTTVSGRPAEVPGAEAMVGLLINTVPVRATADAATNAASSCARSRLV